MHEVKWRHTNTIMIHTYSLLLLLLLLELEAIQAKFKDPVLVLFTHRT